MNPVAKITISFLCLLLAFACLASGNCITYLGNLRGNPAMLIGLFSASAGVASILFFANALKSFFTAYWLLIFALVICVFIFGIRYLIRNNCPIA